ncbi:hypothetical protein [Candidatus Regiella insecticola]|uniref:hypothetical protein n=1 Tax=Candidatus Regiella insecticola TaxID=138073 RepID=UPI0002DFA316|nr:hypothetical protein [Candidatus Regiella insecticola]
MSVDSLRDSASTRRQQRGSFKGEGYTVNLIKSATLNNRTIRPVFIFSKFMR